MLCVLEDFILLTTLETLCSRWPEEQEQEPHWSPEVSHHHLERKEEEEEDHLHTGGLNQARVVSQRVCVCEQVPSQGLGVPLPEQLPRERARAQRVRASATTHG